MKIADLYCRSLFRELSDNQVSVRNIIYSYNYNHNSIRAQRAVTEVVGEESKSAQVHQTCISFARSLVTSYKTEERRKVSIVERTKQSA